MNKHFGKMGYPENIEQLLNQAFVYAFQHDLQMKHIHENLDQFKD